MSIVMTAYGFNTELPTNKFLDYDPIVDWVKNFLFSEGRWPTRADVSARSKELGVNVNSLSREVANAIADILDI